MVGPQTFLAYERFRYLKFSALGLGLAVLLYAVQDAPWMPPELRPLGGPSGGTWLGYTFGAIATAMILWLMWFGIRKRTYQTTGAPLRGWLSAHVYLGLALLLLVPLHSGFQFGWNVHSLAYALMAAVILSGIAGVFFYANVPTPMTRNRPGRKLEALFQQIADIDAECRVEAAGLPDEFARPVATAIDETRVGGGLVQQLRGRDPDCATTRALERLEKLGQELELDQDATARLRKVLQLLTVKQAQLARVRRDMRYKALLDVWLVIHVPLSFATLAAVIVHIFVVFYYW